MKRMTSKELIECLLDTQLDKEVLLSYPKEHIDDMGNKCEGYVFHIDSVEMNGFGVCINFTDWRDNEKTGTNKEVIETLRYLKFYKADKDSTEPYALDFAIKALEERPRGEWIVGEYMDCHSDILPKYTCPFCGQVEHGKYNFCHCGADLRGNG